MQKFFFFLTCAALARVANAQSVFAHFMAQNSYSYAESDWTNDMTTAQNIGINGFALNIVANDYEVDRIVDAYAAAESLGFKLFYSFDMSYTWQQSDMVNIVANHSSSPSTFLWKNAILVSTYSGESYGEDFWASFKSTLQSQGIDIALAPAFTTYRDTSDAASLVSTFPSIDGFFNWWSWPADVDANLTTATDLAYQAAVSSLSGPYIMSVSPWQFKNIDGAGDWVEYSDTLWNYRWQQAVNDVKPDIVEIVTWNDYGESHYIGDINPNVDLGTQAPLYVDGFVHAAWRDVAQYYISWFKTGSAPIITTDKVVFWYRAWPKAITCSTGSLPRNAAYPEDAVFALAMLKDTATITLAMGSNTGTFTAGPGITMGSVSFPPEDSQIPYIAISIDGTTVADTHGSMYVNQNGCTYYNFNPFVGSVSE
ncbi:glycoside hydrolase family 71 protein [Suillus clintonianus]|uniref:glycoside hydrolase family 71 protein n=1 Tax=Suillus clintonianus TaxID=1904413 RepID=UPI001B86DB5D|nr:glycoside hydrolase family 71 protein [Suillus clintonianus]KAG2124416.1 glycoside hydrolase family 71 protein [Suillus clintonianus]